MAALEPRWPLAHRAGFRFVFCYYVLYAGVGIVLDFIPYGNVLHERYGAAWLLVARFAAENILGWEREVYVLEGGVGISNTAFGTLMFFSYLALAALATVVWSVLDRKRPHYARLYPWFRLFVRYSLALAMIHYGTLKVIPVQMISPPPLGFLTQRVGDLTRMRMLWLFMGSSPLYESLTGAAELAGGLLLLVPRTVLLGALLSAANMAMVATLNLAYDVHVKLYSLHLLALALLLVVPDARRLGNVLLFNRLAEPAPPPPPFFTRQWRRPWIGKGLNLAPHVLLLLLGLYDVHGGFAEARRRYATFHPPEPPLYGVWVVEELRRDGEVVPRTSDPKSWRYVFFRLPGAISVEHQVGTRQAYTLELDLEAGRMGLDKVIQDARGNWLKDDAGQWRKEPNTRVELALERPEEEVLLLKGELDGAPFEARLKKMALISKGPGWFFDPPPEDR